MPNDEPEARATPPTNTRAPDAAEGPGSGAADAPAPGAAEGSEPGAADGPHPSATGASADAAEGPVPGADEGPAPEADAAGEGQAVGGGEGRVRRVVRGRPGAVLAGLLVGALLSAGFMAWRDGELPFQERDMCWGSLSADTLHGILSEDGELKAQEVPLRRALSSGDQMRAQCTVQRFEGDELKFEVDAEVRDLENRRGGNEARAWPREFFSADMAPLGGEVTGMASGTRAWVQLPTSCAGGGSYTAPTVVTLSSGRAEGVAYDDEGEYRAGMAKAVVRLANGVMGQKKCAGRYPDPDPRTLVAPSEPKEATEDSGYEVCGIKGLRLPSWAEPSEEYPYRARVTASRKAEVRSCDVGTDNSLDDVRFTTVAAPDLVEIFQDAARKGDRRLTGDGSGSLSGDFSVFIAPCQTGDVAFVAQEDNYARRSLARTMLPTYVTAEAKRIGCGDVKVRER